MQVSGGIRFEVVEEEGDNKALHAYLPEGVTTSDVELTYGCNPEVAEVFFEHIESGKELGRIELPGYSFAEDAVKYNKKQRRFTLGLIAVQPALQPTAAPEAAHGSPRGVVPQPEAVSTSTGNSFGLLDNDDVSDGDVVPEAGGEGAAKKKKKKNKKKNKGTGEAEAAEGAEPAESASASAASAVPTANGDHAAENGAAGSGDEEEPAAAGGEGGAKKKKKNKRKKKKGGAAAAAAAEGGDDADEAQDEENPAAAAATAAAGSEVPAPPVVVAVAAPAAEPSTVKKQPAPCADTAATSGTGPATPAATSPPVPCTKGGARPLTVDMETDFAAEPSGSFQTDTVLPHDPLLGPAVMHALGKVEVKREDRWLEAGANAWSMPALEGATTPVSAFGVFDGHGGRMAAQHAARALLPLVGRYAERCAGPQPPASIEALRAEGYLQGEEGAADEAAVARARAAAAQDALIQRLPKALHAGFVAADAEILARHKASGTTATLAVQVGWELLVANVGDSLAYLDTGNEIVVLSANHRVAENDEEQQRIIAAGGRIGPARYDDIDEADLVEAGGKGKPAKKRPESPPVAAAPSSASVSSSSTPQEGVTLRVWPGGINMTRTLGDYEAEGRLIPDPAVRQISLPVTGARLILASDGLWDAVNAKSIIGQLRPLTAREAAAKAAMFAVRTKKHDDDVTVVVADFLPRSADTHAPGLLKRQQGPAAAALAALAAVGLREERAAQAWRPLETPSESWRDRHRAHRARAAAYLAHLAGAEAAEQEEAQELERRLAAAVAPAAGTAGAGTAIRPAPVSDTYRELAELRLDVDELFEEEGEAEGEGEDAEEEWTAVEGHKKKKDSGGRFDLRSELLRAARPGEVREGGRGAGERGGRRERREGGRERERERPPRRDREANGGPAEVPAEGAAAEAPAGGEERPRRPRGERGERGGRGAGGRGGGRGAGGRGRGATGEGAAATPAVPVSAGVVRKEGEYLYVPKSLLQGGGSGAGGAAAAAYISEAVAEGAPAAEEDGGRKRAPRERGPRDPARRQAQRDRARAREAGEAGAVPSEAAAAAVEAATGGLTRGSQQPGPAAAAPAPEPAGAHVAPGTAPAPQRAPRPQRPHAQGAHDAAGGPQPQQHRADAAAPRHAAPHAHPPAHRPPAAATFAAPVEFGAGFGAGFGAEYEPHAPAAAAPPPRQGSHEAAAGGRGAGPRKPGRGSGGRGGGRGAAPGQVAAGRG